MRSPVYDSRRLGVMLAALMCCTGAGGALAASQLETVSEQVSSLHEKSKDALVKVHTQRYLPMTSVARSPVHRVGTGFFIDGEGRVLTADTVIQGANSCWIEWHGKSVPARLIGRDHEANVAMLQVNPAQCVGPNHPTPSLALGDSDTLRIGSMVVAIGFPYDLPSSPSPGLVRAFEIQRGSTVLITTHIRANCKLSPGEAGAPLLDTSGNVMGIAVASRMNDQCYALPINAARKLCGDFLQFGEPRIGWVGLSVSQRPAPSYDSLSNQWQVFVQQVYSNTPAADAGFRDGDILVRVYTNTVHQVDDVLNTMFYCRCGDRACFTVLRNGQEQHLSVKVGKRPSTNLAMAEPPMLCLPMTQPSHPSLTIMPASEER